MKKYSVVAIGAAALAVFTAFGAAAQTELHSRPDPSARPAQPASPPTAMAPYQAPALPGLYSTSTLGIELGWGAPYGWGMQYAYLVTPNLDLNAGLGLGLGGKIGVGARYYLHPERRVTPYFGAALARTGRIDNVDMSLMVGSREEKANFSFKPSGVLHLRGGLRWQPGTVGLLGTLGYGARLTGDPVVFNDTYSYGTPSREMVNFVRALTAGGVEVSIGVLFNLGRY
ncbi:hypothetical protein [Hymenobacter jeollabukensis]|uniref:Outer membrane protein beta-barrel domain-containing protein n=1 Tax=Hymenobacter jeollabukensis TaxID=2025313 RepID=A0A5R8WKR9_9BACT|nr:hypothetical protein [Hymenobacter jeollabukensis]TLM89533.1 hypothetical protein FDY95_20905 [Hymenobacter jeollabukensis]